MLHHNGGGFVLYRVDRIGGAIYGIGGFDATDIVRVGSVGLASRFDGTEWSTFTSGQRIDFEDVAVTSTAVVAWASTVRCAAAP